MFVRFRKTRQRLQVSLISTRRIDGRVRHEHVASLGAVGIPLSVADRVEFWLRLHERLGQLSNRLNAAVQARVMDQVHARIPMPTGDEIRAVQLANVEADERFWQSLHDMDAEQAEDSQRLAASAARAAAKAKARAEAAGAKAQFLKERAERLKRGEAVAGGLGKRLTREDLERILRDAGWTAADIKSALVVAELSRLGGFEEFQEEISRRHRTMERAAARAILRRRLAARA